MHLLTINERRARRCEDRCESAESRPSLAVGLVSPPLRAGVPARCGLRRWLRAKEQAWIAQLFT